MTRSEKILESCFVLTTLCIPVQSLRLLVGYHLVTFVALLLT